MQEDAIDLALVLWIAPKIVCPQINTRNFFKDECKILFTWFTKTYKTRSARDMSKMKRINGNDQFWCHKTLIV